MMIRFNTSNLKLIFFIFSFAVLQSFGANNWEEKLAKDNAHREALSDLASYWRLPSMKDIKVHCPLVQKVDDSNVGSAFWECNSLVLDCMLDLWENKPKVVQKIVGLRVTPSNTPAKNKEKKFFKYLKVSTNGNYQFFFSQGEGVTFKNNCHEATLNSDKLFAKFVAPGASPIVWASTGKNIKVDQYPVSKLDYLELNESSEVELASIATNYSPKNLQEIDRYCNGRGKKPLAAWVYDAVSFLPKENKRVPRVWSFSAFYERNSSLLKIKDNFQGYPVKAQKDFCKKLFVKECLSFSSLERHYPAGAFSWAGVSQVLGGAAEIIKEDEKNFELIPSSFYLPAKSRWHKLGKRVKVASFSPLRLLEQQEQSLELEALEMHDFSFRCYWEVF